MSFLIKQLERLIWRNINVAEFTTSVTSRWVTVVLVFITCNACDIIYHVYDITKDDFVVVQL